MKGVSQATQPGWSRRGWSQARVWGNSGTFFFQAAIVTDPPPGMKQGSVLAVVSYVATESSGLCSNPLLLQTSKFELPGQAVDFCLASTTFLHSFKVQGKAPGDGQLDWKSAMLVS